MKTIASNTPGKQIVENEDITPLPLGSLGFDLIRKYGLLADAMEKPFMWLEKLDDRSQAFLVVQPALVSPACAPDIRHEDAESPGFNCPEDALVMDLVILRGARQATVRLKGPILLNRHTLAGKRVIPLDAAEFDLRHPFPAAA